jgi:hypothetical protein
VLRRSDKLHQDSCPCRLISDHLAQLPERPTVRTRLISHSMGEHDPRSEVWDYIAVYPSGAIWDNNPPSARYQGRQSLRSKMQQREWGCTGVSRHRSQHLITSPGELVWTLKTPLRAEMCWPYAAFSVKNPLARMS